MRARFFLVRRLTLLSVVILSSGCGPFGYIRQVSQEANRAVMSAEAVGAEELAPYEYWAAKAYFEQAQVLGGYSEYERSFDYANRATQLAEQATNKAKRIDAEEREKKRAASASDGTQEASIEATGSAEGSR
jgi:hypothetical protein